MGAKAINCHTISEKRELAGSQSLIELQPILRSLSCVAMSCPPARINACCHSHFVLAREAVDKDIADVSYHSILWALTYSTENAGNVQTTCTHSLVTGQPIRL